MESYHGNHVPLGFLIRNVLSEQKRLDILVNKTRESAQTM